MATHYDRITGEDCDCPWGEPNPLLYLAGRKIDWLESQNDHKLQSEEGQRLLAWLRQLEDQGYGHTDHLAPFLAKEFRAGRLTHSPDYGGWTADVDGRKAPLNTTALSEWGDWLRSQAPNRRGVNILSPNFTVGDLNERMPPYREWKAQQRAYQQHKDALKGGDVIHRFPDGWHIKKLTDADHCRAEGHLMQNCIKDHPYLDDVPRGDRLIYSLRDPKHIPHVSMEFWPKDDGGLESNRQTYGKANSAPKQEYIDRIRQWVDTIPMDQRPRSRMYWEDGDDEYPLEDYRDLEDFEHEEAKRNNRIQESQRQRELGQAPQPQVDPYGFPQESVNPSPLKALYDWPSLMDSMMGGTNQQYYNDGSAEALYNHAKQRGQIPELGREFSGWAEDKDDDFFSGYEPYPYTADAFGLDEPAEDEYEDPAEYERAYANFEREYENRREEADGEDQDAAYQQWPYGEAIKEMYARLNPHYDHTTQSWANELPQELARTARRKPIQHIGRDGEICHCGYGSTNEKTRYFQHHREVVGRQIHYLRKRPDLQSDKWPEAPYILEMLENGNHFGKEYDHLFPWIIRELKEGRLELPAGIRNSINEALGAKEGLEMGHDRFQDGAWSNPEPLQDYYDRTHNFALSYGRNYPLWRGDLHEQFGAEDVDRINQWYQYHRARKATPNLLAKNDPSNHANRVVKAARDWENDQDENYRKTQHGVPVHEFPDGWSMRYITSPREARLESKDLDHCIGKSQYGYPEKIQNGTSWNLSLRDPENRAHATMEIFPTTMKSPTGEPVTRNSSMNYPPAEGWRPAISGSDIHQIQGRNDDAPNENAINYLHQFMDDHGLVYAGGPHSELFHGEDEDEDEEEIPEQWWDPQYEAPGPSTIDEYKYYIDDPSEFYPDEFNRAQADYYNWGEQHGYDNYSEPEIWVGNPEFDRMFDEASPTHSDEFNPEHSQRLHDLARENWDIPQLAEAWKGWRDHNWDEDWRHKDPEGGWFMDWWDSAIKEHQNPETGRFDSPQLIRNGPPGSWPTAMGGWQTAMDRWWQNGGEQQYHDRLPPQLPGFEWGQNRPPATQVHQVMSSVAMGTPPMYYRWVFSPNTAEVDVSYNDEAHPTEVNTHGDLARARGEANLVHGYATRIGGGWRLTDWEHRPVSDPFIVAHVVNRLNSQGSYQPGAPEGPAWEFQQPDYDRLHHGIASNL